MKKRWLFPLLFLSLGLNIGLLFMRFSPPRRPPRPRPGMDHFLKRHLSRMTVDLDLKDEQRDKLKVIYDRLFPDMLEISSRVEQYRKELAKYYASPQFKAEELKGHLDRLNAAHTALDSLIAETILSEASILSGEQRQRYLKEMPWKRSEKGAGQRPQGKPHGRAQRGPHGRPPFDEKTPTQ